MIEPRLPVEPLEALLGATTNDALAEVFEVADITVGRWRTDGIPWRKADQLAVAAGHHPAAVWPEWLDHSIALNSELCDRPGLTSFGRGCRCPGCRADRADAVRRYRSRRAAS